MKTQKNYWISVMIIAILMGVFSSCEKDEEIAPMQELSAIDNMLTEFNQECIDNNLLLVESLWTTQIDTIWPTDEFGLPIRERDPITGEWIINGTVETYITPNEAYRRSDLFTAEAVEALKNDIRTWQSQNPDSRISIIEDPYDENGEIIDRIVGEYSFHDVLAELNNVGSLLVQNPSMTADEIISNQVNSGLEIIQEAKIEALNELIEGI